MGRWRRARGERGKVAAGGLPISGRGEEKMAEEKP
jgi:hypothetical protein